MMIFAFIAHATAFAVLALLTWRLWRNLRFLRWTRTLVDRPAPPPRVSVLVPARNESATITTCIQSLAAQQYPNFEIIALDDHSSDDTGAQLDALATRFPNLTVLHGAAEPPPGWNGKSYACQRLAERASGEWLLFTDADTLHEPHSLARGVAQAVALEVDLLSAFPHQRTDSWSERVLVSFIVDFLPLLGLDLAGMARGRSDQTAANGQYLLVQAASYHTAGGHRAIAGALVDDFALAGRFEQQGRKIALVDGTTMLQCRMYRDAREVWRGFAKNIWLALENSSGQKYPVWWIPLFFWTYACLFVLPFVFIVVMPGSGWALLTLGWLGMLRGIANWHLRRPMREVFTTPLAAWGVMALGLGALLSRWRKRTIIWKGRAYAVDH